MKETAWRTSLIGALESRKDLFIRVNEVRAARGFPDLTMIFKHPLLHPVAAFYELKVVVGSPKKLAPLFDPIQLVTLKRLQHIGCRSMGLIRLENRAGICVAVAICDFLYGEERIVAAGDFWDRWRGQSAVTPL